MLKKSDSDELENRAKDWPRLQRLMGDAIKEMLRVKKLLGQPVVTFRDGQVVWVPPEEIPVDVEPKSTKPSS